MAVAHARFLPPDDPRLCEGAWLLPMQGSYLLTTPGCARVHGCCPCPSHLGAERPTADAASVAGPWPSPACKHKYVRNWLQSRMLSMAACQAAASYKDYFNTRQSRITFIMDIISYNLIFHVHKAANAAAGSLPSLSASTDATVHATIQAGPTPRA